MATIAASPSKKILVGDVDREQLRQTCDVLRYQGYDLVPAQDGREVLRKVLTEMPDAILLDASLAEADGIDVCALLRSKKETQEIPLALLTDPQDADAERKTAHANALLFIPRPFKPQQLLSATSLLVSFRRKVPAAR